MSNVVRFPPKRPPWLLLVHGRLMVRADRPLADLHRMARLAGLSRDAYRPGAWPCYRLSGRAAAICVRVFGRMLGEDYIATALQMVDRRSRQERTHAPRP